MRLSTTWILNKSLFLKERRNIFDMGNPRSHKRQDGINISMMERPLQEK
jgi:hypothetical protein